MALKRLGSTQLSDHPAYSILKSQNSKIAHQLKRDIKLLLILVKE